MKKTSKYFFSILFFVFYLISGYSQELRVKGIRFGVDISRFALLYFAPERTNYEVSADFEIKRNIYPAIEYGTQSVNLKKSTYNYYSEGTYVRFGTDYNFQKNVKENAYDMIFGGIRFGMATFTHYAENITIENNYWGNYFYGSVAKKNLKAYWIEASAGVRAELFKNFFMGWSLRGRILIKKTGDEYMYPYNIPGFGKGNKKSRLGFNYSLYYRIPIYKEKMKETKKTK
jgi:hypothetical protein